jgi:sugar transferase EpsL
MRQAGWQFALKVILDRTVAAVLLIVLSPLIAVIAAIVRITMGSPVLFRQTRPGFHERPIRIAKFRTMRDALDKEGRPLPDVERLTLIGRMIRAASLDELPQLWNVLRGDLSLVGPRPLLMQYLDRYSPEQRRRHDVMPGVTGWAQINGRNAISWPQKFALDLWYVDHWSVWLDLEILARTFGHVIARKQTQHPGHVSMPEFMGNEES